jgi:hypothetical protein
MEIADLIEATSIGPTIEEVEITYNGGYIDTLREDVREYVQLKAKDILQFKLQYELKHKKTISIEDSICLYVKNSSVNPLRDNMDQLKEMEKEIWIVHEKDPRPTDDEIRINWINKYGKKFRTYRQTFYAYIAFCERKYFSSILCGNS